LGGRLCSERIGSEADRVEREKRRVGKKKESVEEFAKEIYRSLQEGKRFPSSTVLPSSCFLSDGDLMLSVDDETDNGMTLISSAGIDLEIVTEDLAIKTHENIWKAEEKALDEELRMLESEKASHMKVPPPPHSPPPFLLRSLSVGIEENPK
jgi:hypothetical protein